MAIFLDQGLQGHRPGHHRLRGHQAHRAACSRPARDIVGGVNARQGRHRPSTARAARDDPGVRHRRRGDDETGADVSVVFVPPRFAKDAVDRGHRRRDPARRGHHRGHPGARHRASSTRTPQNAGTTRIIGPNCPGIISPGRVATPASSPANITGPGRDRPGVQVGHADLPDDVRAARPRLLDRRRHRRRPGHRHHAHRRLAAFEDDPETDAIVMIGEIGGDAEERAAAYIKDQRHQAGRRLRRRLHRARGQDHGPRRRHRLRLLGHRRRPRRRPSRPPASRSARRRPRPPALMREIIEAK